MGTFERGAEMLSPPSQNFHMISWNNLSSNLKEYVTMKYQNLKIETSEISLLIIGKESTFEQILAAVIDYMLL